jgi:hypothetical protein
VGAQDRDHPSGQHGSDAERCVMYWPMWEGSDEPGCVRKRHITPLATSSI